MKKNSPLNLPVYQANQQPDTEEKIIADGVGAGFQVFFLMIAGLILLNGLSAGGAFGKNIGDLAINFCSLILEAMPFMLIGTLTGGSLKSFYRQNSLIVLCTRKRYQRCSWLVQWGWSCRPVNVPSSP